MTTSSNITQHQTAAEHGILSNNSMRGKISYKDFAQDEAFAILKNTIYKGESNKHKFEYYANKHIRAHKLLVESVYNNGHGMDDATKIQHLKSEIKIEASLEHALTTSRTSGLLRGTFTEFVSFLQAEVNEMQSRRRELRTNININKMIQPEWKNENTYK